MSARRQPPPAQRRPPALSLASLAFFVLLILLPVFALWRLTEWADGRLLTAVPIALSLFAYLAYRSDKRRAETGKWRVPESTLHLAELLGGWPGAFLAQRVYRHKTAKLSFQIVFWMIVAAYQLAALDLVSDGKIRSALIHLAG